MLINIFLILITLTLFHSAYGLYLLLISKNNEEFTNNANTPIITIQLPIYNESNVVERLLESVFSIDYPKDKLQIQVLDDSTDKTSNLIQEKLNQNINKFEWNYNKRNNRKGFKAGALNNALKNAKGEYILILDADFLPQPNFLKDLIKNIDDSHSCFQAKWSYANYGSSLLTNVQKLNLDHHFEIFQNSRYYSDNFLNFNGTAGLWRKSDLVEIGGWEEGTIAEDLDTSLKAQFFGKKIKYINSINCKSELPEYFNDFEGQQKRWVKGSAQVFRKYFWSIFKSNLPLNKKLHTLIFLSFNFIFPIILLITILNPFFLIEILNKNINYDFMNIYFLGGIFIFIQHQIAQKQKPINIRYLPFLMMGSMGLSISFTFSFISGLFSKNAEFIRTEKQGDKNRKYLKRKLSILIILEFIMLIYYTLFIISFFSIGKFITAILQLFFLFSFLIIIFIRIKEYIKKPSSIY
jgi:cellulose synthase/poly-beta-1,6-N-acetylglucosamine synthase-like glycosyltransferase